MSNTPRSSRWETASGRRVRCLSCRDPRAGRSWPLRKLSSCSWPHPTPAWFDCFLLTQSGRGCLSCPRPHVVSYECWQTASSSGTQVSVLSSPTWPHFTRPAGVRWALLCAGCSPGTQQEERDRSCLRGTCMLAEEADSKLVQILNPVITGCHHCSWKQRAEQGKGPRGGAQSYLGWVEQSVVRDPEDRRTEEGLMPARRARAPRAGARVHGRGSVKNPRQARGACRQAVADRAPWHLARSWGFSLRATGAPCGD